MCVLQPHPALSEPFTQAFGCERSCSAFFPAVVLLLPSGRSWRCKPENRPLARPRCPPGAPWLNSSGSRPPSQPVQPTPRRAPPPASGERPARQRARGEGSPRPAIPPQHMAHRLLRARPGRHCPLRQSSPGHRRPLPRCARGRWLPAPHPPRRGRGCPGSLRRAEAVVPNHKRIPIPVSGRGSPETAACFRVAGSATNSS